MKKKIVLLFSSILAISLLAGCGGNKDTSSVTSSKAPSTSVPSTSVPSTSVPSTSASSTSSSTSVHTHTFASEWTRDETHHWHSSTCGHDVVSDKAAHTWGDWDVKVAAGCVTKGLEERECSVCGRTEQRDINPTGDHVIENDGTCHGKDCTFEVFNVATEGNTFEDFDVYEGKIYIHFMTQCSSIFKLKFNFAEQKIKENFGIYDKNTPNVNVYNDLDIQYSSSGSISYYYSANELSSCSEYYLVLELASGYEDLKTINMMVSATAYHELDETGFCGECGFEAQHNLTAEEDNNDVTLKAHINRNDYRPYSYVHFNTLGLKCCPLEVFRMDSMTLESKEGSDCINNVNLYYADKDGNLVVMTINKDTDLGYSVWTSVDNLMLDTYYYVEIEYDSLYEDPTLYFSYHDEHEIKNVEGFEVCDTCGEIVNGINYKWSNSFTFDEGTKPGTYYASMDPVRTVDSHEMYVSHNIEAEDEDYVTITYYNEAFEELTSFNPYTYEFTANEYEKIYVKTVITRELECEITGSCRCKDNDDHYDYNGYCSKCGQFLGGYYFGTPYNENKSCDGEIDSDMTSGTNIYVGYYSEKVPLTFSHIYFDLTNCNLMIDPLLFDLSTNDYISLEKINTNYYKLADDVEYATDYFTKLTLVVKLTVTGSDPYADIYLNLGPIE